MGQKRKHEAPSSTALVLSGDLGGQLVLHTRERVRHFFQFLYLYRMLMLLLKVDPKNWESFVSVVATHQIDTGVRRASKDEVVSFDKTSGGIVELPTTAFGKLDAAHFCNLGLKGNLDGLSAKSKDDRVFPLYARLKVTCGNTRWLPQRINIGPDRVVDKAHGELCKEFLKEMRDHDKAAINPDFFDRYRDRVVAGMTEYARQHAQLQNDGIVAAAQVYIDVLASTPSRKTVRVADSKVQVLSTQESQMGEIWNLLFGDVNGDYFALNLRSDPGVSIELFMSGMVS